VDGAIVAEGVALRDFRDFYRSEYPSIFRATWLATGDRDAAFDATQEAFKRAFVRWRRLRKHEWAGGWVMTTALNLCKDSARRTRRERQERRLEPASGDIARSSATVRLDVAAALRKLPSRQRTALTLFYIGDLPLPAIAGLMEISEGTVKAHLAQGRAALRKLLEERDE
jgi:RNA polymerase sigma-70 factor (ECF subfamily)